MNVWTYSILSVFIVSLVSFVGILTLSMKADRLKRILIYFISFSAGALFGDVFLHLLPEAVEKQGFGLNISFGILGGIFAFFVLEKVVHWQHCHMPHEKGHIHVFAYTNLIGDGLHNFIDGLIISTSYLVNVQVGIATTLAVILHEIPQEIGDFGVLLHGGFSKGKALLLNFASALFSIFGALIGLWLAGSVNNALEILVPLVAGGFIYIAGSDLIPELHKEGHNGLQSWMQVLSFILGIEVMTLLLII